MMATLTIPDLPEAVYKPLAERAARHGRSVEQEALDCLLRALSSEPEAADAATQAKLRELRQFRESLRGIYVTEEDLQQAKREGRT
jgi:plasmid stability protein